MTMSLLKLLSAASAASVLAGCSLPGATLRTAPTRGDIRGIESALSKQKPVHVLYVHGICPKDARWVDESAAALKDSLGMEIVPPSESAEGQPIGKFGGRLHRRHLHGPNGDITMYAIRWSPVTDHVRQSLCYDVSSATMSCPSDTGRLPDQRASFNALLKDKMMDGCLSEAVYAVGEDGIRKIGSTIERGLEIALGDGTRGDDWVLESRKRDEPLFIVTQSLGSKLFVDAAIRLANGANGSCEAYRSMAFTMKRTAQVFMEANQLPILSLAYDPNLRTDCKPIAKDAESVSDAKGLNALGVLRKTPSGGPEPEALFPLKVAAFSDPNDLLSYTLYPARDRYPALEITDIVLVNDWAWLGIVENPMTAHVTYGEKCRVHKVIAKGTAGLAERCPPLQ